jgi:hypothetical protein
MQRDIDRVDEDGTAEPAVTGRFRLLRHEAESFHAGAMKGWAIAWNAGSASSRAA